MRKNKITDEKFMRLAINKAKEGIKRSQTPFGACIVKKGRVISCSYNRVWKNTDITAHAEICAIRDACRKLNTTDLSGCVVYSTCEPCPMCFSACHWGKVSRIVYGVRIRDARRFAFNELALSNKKMKQLAGSPVKVVGNCLYEENLNLFRIWSRRKDRKAY